MCFTADPIHKEKVLGQENMDIFLLVPTVFDLHLVSPQPVDDRQLSISVEKKHVAPSGKQSIVLLKSCDNKMCFSHPKEGTC